MTFIIGWRLLDEEKVYPAIRIIVKGFNTGWCRLFGSSSQFLRSASFSFNDRFPETLRDCCGSTCDFSGGLMWAEASNLTRRSYEQLSKPHRYALRYRHALSAD